MQSIAYTNQGSKPLNKDAYYANQPLFIVCDGVDGLPYGEVASKLACSTISGYFKANPASIFDCDYLNEVLRYTIRQFQETEKKYPELKGMATTAVIIAFDKDGAIVSWLGDSRLYHIRDGKILYFTEDHSLINDLVETQHLASPGSPKTETPTTADKYQNIRHIITRSLSAITKGGFSSHGISKNKIHPGDYFFLCTDGVLENITDEKINHIFSQHSVLEEIKQEIINECDGKTNDNFTFQVIQI